MATVGNSTNPATAFFFYGINVQNAAWSGYTMPAGGGLITSISAFFDLDTGGPATCYLCIWDGNNGTLLASVAVGGIPAGSQSAGGQAWHTANLATPLFVAGGAALAIGFWVPQANGLIASTESGGTTFSGTQAGSGPGAASGPAVSGQGALGAYATYTPGNVWVWNGSAWVAGSLPSVWNGSAQVQGIPQVWNGSSWVLGS